MERKSWAVIALGIFLVLGIGLGIAHTEKPENVEDDDNELGEQMMSVCSKMLSGNELDEDSWEKMREIHQEHHQEEKEHDDELHHEEGHRHHHGRHSGMMMGMM